MIDPYLIYLSFQTLLKRSFHDNSIVLKFALLRVFRDLVNSIDSGNIVLINLLDLSAAFDTGDHYILIKTLNVSFGFSLF